MTNEKTGKHSRGVICPICTGSLKALFYYTQFGTTERAGTLFYCNTDNKIFNIEITEVPQ